MAYQISGSIQAGILAAINAEHADRDHAGLAHYDGPEWSSGSSPAEQAIPTLTGIAASTSVTTLTHVVSVVNQAKALHNLHITYHNAGNGSKIYAHKAVESVPTTIATADMASAASYETSMLASLSPLVIEVLTDLKNHMLNQGGAGNFHATADSFNSIGLDPSALSSPLTAAQCASYLNLARAVYEAHRVYTTGGVHGLADATNTIAADPVDTPNDWDQMYTLSADLKTKLNAHIVLTAGAVHAFADGTNTVTTAAATYPANIFDLATNFKIQHNTHLADATVHANVDGANILSYSTPTTIALLITAAKEIFDEQTNHFRSAPRSAAVRAV